MKIFILLISFFILASCSNQNLSYWCGDHPCINKKEREAYFKKTMIIEVKEINIDDKKKKSEIDKIIQQAKINEKKRILDEKRLAKEKKNEEKMRIKQEKESAKIQKLEEKRILKEEKELEKQIKLDEKKMKKDKRKLAKKNKKIEKKNIQENNIDKSINSSSFATNSSNFDKIVDNIIKRNSSKSYPDINGSIE